MNQSNLFEMREPLIRHGDHIQVYKQVKPEGWKFGQPWDRQKDFIGKFVGMALDGGADESSYSVFVVIDDEGHFSTVPIHLCQKIIEKKGPYSEPSPSTNNT